MKNPRMSATLAVAVLLGLLIAALAPQQLPVTLYKLSLITCAAVAGYYIDRELFPYARPDGYLGCLPQERYEKIEAIGHGADYRVNTGYDLVFAAAMLRRALVVAACIIAVALGA